MDQSSHFRCWWTCIFNDIDLITQGSGEVASNNMPGRFRVGIVFRVGYIASIAGSFVCSGGELKPRWKLPFTYSRAPYMIASILCRVRRKTPATYANGFVLPSARTCLGIQLESAASS